MTGTPGAPVESISKNDHIFKNFVKTTNGIS